MNELADELADVVICTHLLANKFGVEIYEMPSGFDTSESVENELLSLAVYTGQACNIAKKLERERLGLAGSRATVGQLRNQLNYLLWQTTTSRGFSRSASMSPSPSSSTRPPRRSVWRR
jgi:hypothetical protein